MIEVKYFYIGPEKEENIIGIKKFDTMKEALASAIELDAEGHSIIYVKQVEDES